MSKKWFNRIVEVTVLTLVMAAIFQELEKPKEERSWHGRIGFIPYDLRVPTLERFRQAYWNPEDSRIFLPEPFGIGWAINFHALLEKLRIIGESYLSEENYLMPGRHMRDVLRQAYDVD